MSLYRYLPHPHAEARRQQGPVRTRPPQPRFNQRLGLLITAAVGTMVCAYVFMALALISLPSALASGNLTVIIAWLSSNFLQLALLPVIIVGQNMQAQASDKRAEQTYLDAEAILHECRQIHGHLEEQDKILTALIPLAVRKDGP